MTFYTDLANTTMISSGPHVRAIGWLDDIHAFPTGKTPAAFVQQLRYITEKCFASEDALGWTLDSFFGVHTCELCHKFDHKENFGVPAGEVLYVAPAMILHYVEEHGYLPPEQFVDAVLESPIPGTKAYEDAVVKFQELHERYRGRY
jgi:hypothetical protein